MEKTEVGIVLEILAGNGFENAVNELDLSAEKKYGTNYRGLEVWTVSEDSFQKMIDIPDDDWKESWGWWRSAKGSNISDWPTHRFNVNGKSMVGYYDIAQLDMWKEDGFEADLYFEQSHFSLTNYLAEVIGASTEKNVCAVAVDLARLNEITMAELFERYEPKAHN